jgi:DNA-binding NtrC family response regulator
MFSSRRPIVKVPFEEPPTMAKPTAVLKVLYAELNEQVLISQAESLQKAGFSVQTAVGRKAVQDALEQGHFDLVVLGPTLTRDDRHHLPYMVKKADSRARVLVMHTDGSRHPYVDSHIDTGSSMEELLRKIASLQQTKAIAAGAGK